VSVFQHLLFSAQRWTHSQSRQRQTATFHRIRREHVIVTTRRNQSTALPARAAHAASSLLLCRRGKEGFNRWRGDCVMPIRTPELRLDDGGSVRRFAGALVRPGFARSMFVTLCPKNQRQWRNGVGFLYMSPQWNFLSPWYC
jgi:hypothetical protein